MRKLNCRGWWEQNGFGRQEMSPLELTISSDQLEGQGVDIIGPFQLSGVLDGAKVSFQKEYLQRHKVRYHGVYDGEGTYHGQWFLNSDSGNWVIQIDRSTANRNPAEAAELGSDIPLFEPS